MTFKFNDGGRSLYFKGKGGDCVTRAIAIAAQLDYKEVYNRLAEGNKNQRKSKRQRKSAAIGKKTALYGIATRRKWFKDYMKELGFTWVPTMKIGQGCKVHLSGDELPAGRLVVAVSRHYTCVIDGVIHDTWDPRRFINCIAPAGSTLIPKIYRDKAPNSDGMVTWVSRRCVYGYWKHQ